MNDTAATDSKEQRAFWVQQVNANMGIEGMPPDEFTQELQRRYIEGTLAVEDMAKETMAAFLALKNTN
jgi:ribosomal protein L20